MTPKMLAVLAALGLATLIALPAPTSAEERRADGVRNLDQIEVSSARRNKRRYVRRYRGPGVYYRPYYARPYYYDPYYAYGYYPYYHRRYYYRRGPHFWFGPGGFSFGF